MISIFPVFIKPIVFHHVGISWKVETEEQYNFSIDEHFPCWSAGGPWYNTIISKNLHGPIFEGFFVTSIQSRYKLMCG